MQKNNNNTADLHCADCFRSLGVPTRIEIFKYLAKRKRASVGEVVDTIGLTQPTISYHLKEMTVGGMLDRKKEGKTVYYSINVKCPHSHEDCALKTMDFSWVKKF